MKIEIISNNEIKIYDTIEEFKTLLRKILQRDVQKLYGIHDYKYSQSYVGKHFFLGKEVKFKLPKILVDENGAALENIKEYCERVNCQTYFTAKVDEINKYIIHADFRIEFLTENVFLNRNVSNIDGIETIFMRNEIVKLAENLNSSHLRQLLKKSEENFQKIIEILNEYRVKFGDYIMSYILKLDKINFGNKQSYLISNYDNKPKLLPTLQIKVGKESFTIFFYPSGRSNNTISYIKDQSGYKVGQISKDGEIKSTNYKLSLMLNLIAKPNDNGVQIYSNVEDGKCIYCGLPLTDPTSKIYGYGKDCAENEGLPYG